jgi:hypothetical protein
MRYTLHAAVLTLVVLLFGACASLPKPSIEQTLKDLRSACALIGSPDSLDVCAAKLQDMSRGE